MGSSGPMQFAQSPSVANPTYNSDPSKYQAFNFTPQMNAATANVNQNIGNQQRNAQAQATAAGAGRSAGNSAAMRDLNAQGQQQVNNMNLGAAENSFNQQLGQENAQNTYNLNEQANQEKQYNDQNANFLNEQALRRGQVGQLPGGGLINLYSNPA